MFRLKTESRLAVGQRSLLFGDDFALSRHLSVQLDVLLLIVRHVVFVVDRFDRALGYTGFAIDAFIRVDVKHALALVEALNGANDDAIGIPATITGFCYYVSHSG